MAKKKSTKPEESALSERVTTRKQAETVVRAVGRTCRGPKNQDWPAFAGRFAEVKPPKVVAPTTDGVVAWLLGEGRLEEARRLDAATRVGCGQDYNDLILASPLDGQTHEVVCPKCGVASSYTAPTFPDLKAT